MTDDKAREALVQQIAEAIYTQAQFHTNWRDMTQGARNFWIDVSARAVLPIADAEAEAATRDLRAEVERLRKRGASLEADLKQANLWSWELHDRAEAAEAERDQLRAAISALADEWEDRYAHAVDQRTTGRDRITAATLAMAAHDVRALARVGAADTQPEGAGDDDMCPNCVTPWKCNGPHTPTAGGKVEGSEIPSPETSGAGSSDTAPEADEGGAS